MYRKKRKVISTFASRRKRVDEQASKELRRSGRKKIAIAASEAGCSSQTLDANDTINKSGISTKRGNEYILRDDSNGSIANLQKKTKRNSDAIADNVAGSSSQSLDAKENPKVANVCTINYPRVTTTLDDTIIIRADGDGSIGNVQKKIKRDIDAITDNVAGSSSQRLHANENFEVTDSCTIIVPKVTATLDNIIIISDDSDDNASSASSDTEECDNGIYEEGLNISDPIYYEAHPQYAVEECVALTNNSLEFVKVNKDGLERVRINISCFSIYDEHGHLCAIDNDFEKNEIKLYMSGYLKTISTILTIVDKESVPTKDIGPILQWFIHSINGGKRNSIILSTEYAEYVLLNPSDQYKPFINDLYEKIWISNVVVAHLQNYHFLIPSYEDMLKLIEGRRITELDNKKMTEEMLHKHAIFLLDQAANLFGVRDGGPLITLPCMQELSKIINKEPDARCKIKFQKKDKKSWTKATTTPLVRKTFESFFANQMDKTNPDISRKKRCGICESCQQPDCGECRACKAMPKFGGDGRSKKACIKRFCPDMANEPEEESDSDNDTDSQQMDDEKRHDDIVNAVLINQTSSDRIINWIGRPIQTDSNNVYYEKVEIDGLNLCIGDFVTVETSRSNIPSLIGRIVYMWRETTRTSNENYFHGEMFFRSCDTILGEAGHPREIFLSDTCCHSAPLSAILKKANVEKKEIPANWSKLGGEEVEETPVDDDGETYFYSKYYDRFTARFEDIAETLACTNELRLHRFCPSCERKGIRDSKQIPIVLDQLEVKSSLIKDFKTEWSCVRWLDYDYKKGCAVFLKPGTFRLKNSLRHTTKIKKLKRKKVDNNIYTEYYRKIGNNHHGSNITTDTPFCVGYIAAVTAGGEGPLVIPQDIYLKVNVMYRPENTNNKNPRNEDLNVVYWSDEIVEVSFSAVEGPCDLIYEQNVPKQNTLYEWLDKDPSRLYFKSAYNKVTGRIVDVPSHATCVGKTAQSRAGEEEKGKSSLSEEIVVDPLGTLDVFAGCGGLSEGLYRSGAAKCRWAIENSETAAQAYIRNYSDCCVFIEDCNALLSKILSGATHSTSGLILPIRGEVELVCGGPPCQGFSGMNRFNSRDYSKFKNSLVVSFLSYCDYYRPKYFILENVRNFVAYKRGMVLKLTLRALLDMGYQCTFGVLQAGNFGVPQSRRRLIILAAAPGCVLPGYPEPTHVFNHRGCPLTVKIDKKLFYNNTRWATSAPRRGSTIRDAMSDLPKILTGALNDEMEYGSIPETHYQREARGHSVVKAAKLYNHVCKNMSPLVLARICRIPTTPGSDWRDLPNISVKLSDKATCKVLQYRYEIKRKGLSASSVLRGVCACAEGRPCSPQDKQDNTLIPWCLPHTGNRHNHWAGLYGRLSWDGYFSTTVTDPEPMGKQGRVLHPEQSRVVSVRECARSQGFPDGHIFVGTTLEKYRQIGNAVPPPLSAALGRQLYKAMKASKSD